MMVIRHLAATGCFRCVLGVNAGFGRQDGPALDVLELPRVEGERISLGNIWRARAAARAVRDWLRAEPGRVFHGHSRAGLLVALWLRWWGEPPVVVSVHCYGRQRWFYRAAKKILGQRLRWLTPAMRRYYFGGVPADWTDCVPNGVPGTPAAEMRCWPGGRTLRLGGAGQLTANKRWHLVIAALARLPADAPVEYYHLGGSTGDPDSTAYTQELKALTARHGLDDQVHWLGWQPSSAGLLREVDAVVVPFHQEAFSLIALEALYAGVPVIAARGGGPDDLILDGVNGWLFEPDDPAALAALWRDLLQPDAWRELRVDTGHLQRFSAPVVAEQWARIYERLLAGQ